MQTQSRPEVDPRRYFESVGARRSENAQARPVCVYLETTNRCNLPMQDCPLQVGNLVDDPGEKVPAHVGGRLQCLKGPRACGAEKIAAIGGFEVEAHRIGECDRISGRFDGFMITPRVYLR